MYDMSVWRDKPCFQHSYIMKAKCRPTMKTKPPFYSLFVTFHTDSNDKWTIESALCTCATGQSMSCVHTTALLLSIMEVSDTPCTSLPCLWKRPSGQAKGQLFADLTWGTKGKCYTDFDGELLDPFSLLAAVQSIPGGDKAAGVQCFSSFRHNPFSKAESTITDPLLLLQGIGEKRVSKILTSTSTFCSV